MKFFNIPFHKPLYLMFMIVCTDRWLDNGS